MTASSLTPHRSSHEKTSVVPIDSIATYDWKFHSRTKVSESFNTWAQYVVRLCTIRSCESRALALWVRKKPARQYSAKSETHNSCSSRQTVSFNNLGLAFTFWRIGEIGRNKKSNNNNNTTAGCPTPNAQRSSLHSSTIVIQVCRIAT